MVIAHLGPRLLLDRSVFCRFILGSLVGPMTLPPLSSAPIEAQKSGGALFAGTSPCGLSGPITRNMADSISAPASFDSVATQHDGLGVVEKQGAKNPSVHCCKGYRKVGVHSTYCLEYEYTGN